MTATHTIPGIGPKTKPVSETAHQTQYTGNGISLTLSITEAGGSSPYSWGQQA